jgi:hypothetical protein
VLEAATGRWTYAPSLPAARRWTATNPDTSNWGI